MKKTFRYILGGVAVAMLPLLASCNGNKLPSADSEQQVDNQEVAQAEEAAAPQSIPEMNDKPMPPEELAKWFQSKDNEQPKDSTGYITTASGLKVWTVVPGTGARPSETSSVTVHYTGYLTDGTVFDSSVARGEPATFPLNGVIAGWTEGLQLMKEGGTDVFYIPSRLAYGERDLPGIPANSDLIFVVQLLKVTNR